MKLSDKKKLWCSPFDIPEIDEQHEKIAQAFIDQTNDRNNVIADITRKQIKELNAKQEQLFIDKINQLEGTNFTKEDILQLNPNDFAAVIYEEDPYWTHYFYKGKRILSLKKPDYSETQSTEDGYVMSVTQQYY